MSTKTVVGADGEKSEVFTPSDQLVPWRFSAPAGGNVLSAAAQIKAAVAGRKNRIKTLVLAHDARGVATQFILRNVGGAELFRISLQTAALVPVPLFFEPPLEGIVNTALEVITSAATTGAVYVNASGDEQI